MGEPRVSAFWARVWTGVVVGVVASTFLALAAGLVGLVYGLVTWNGGVVWPTLRLVGLIYVVFIPITVVRSVRRGRVSAGVQEGRGD